jgi:predicted DNA-binding protein
MPKPLQLYGYRLGRESRRRLCAVAKLYGIPAATFVREMIEATVLGDQARTMLFLQRVQSGMTHQRQLDLFAEARAEARKPGKVARRVVQQGKGAQNAT